MIQIDAEKEKLEKQKQKNLELFSEEAKKKQEKPVLLNRTISEEWGRLPKLLNFEIGLKTNSF